MVPVFCFEPLTHDLLTNIEGTVLVPTFHLRKIYVFNCLIRLQAMAALASSKEADWNAMRLREKELAAVKINPADVEIIANELELDKKIAERTLREHKGDAVAAVRFLLR
ncbi:hypothetical protein E2562_014001 [Oryza meyeriana var. granulata]|uniref:Nascent polypeptide-associated complex subunit alpha-like UBA domain-containing protein n=1 Tax=Oryza meyeriana var. granulata TaxID=110450 RepID=A0A6G1DJF0_9ORYZ|nr:hypothetical protein E2562_014001 [Oryza meyeriana var. granulata]